jgi:hypothetical protein
VKSDGDFEDILAADKPDVWHSNRPAKGGEAGAMLATIIERAGALKAGKSPPPAAPRRAAAKPTESKPRRKTKNADKKPGVKPKARTRKS